MPVPAFGRFSEDRTGPHPSLYCRLNCERSKGFINGAIARRMRALALTTRNPLTTKCDEQKTGVDEAGETPIYRYNQTDFVKDRVAVEVQFGKYSFVAYDLFVKHLAFYVGDRMDVGIEILPMKYLQSQMSSGVARPAR